MDTPEFLVWAIEHRCPIRGSLDGSDPERTERQLRSGRAVSDARREGRVFADLCVDPPDGFRIDDALAIYGGLADVESECSTCHANALAELVPETLAGCYGLVPLPDDPSHIHDAVERGIEMVYPRADWSKLCSVTMPRWYGLWLNSPLSAERLRVPYLVLNAALITDDRCRASVAELLVALNAAFNAGCRLHIQLFPGGRVEGGWWLLNRHCPRCKAPWEHARSKECSCCGYAGYPAPEKKRRARGRRPYFPLDRLLGKDAAADFLVRYEAFRAPQRPRGRVQSPLPSGPRDNPRDD